MNKFITILFNRNKITCLILFDICKAFDKTWHFGILHKLLQLKVPLYLTKWIKSFLSHRLFCVKVNEAISDFEEISIGVPQGATLSPLLFSIFINDIPKPDKKFRNFSLLFADDLGCAFSFKKPGNLSKIINTYLKSLNDWFVKWRLNLNVSKCSYTVFAKGSKKEDKLSLKICQNVIPYQKNPIFLGIQFDERLTFNKQVENIKNKCYDRLKIIKILSHKSWKLNATTLIRI